MTVRAIGDRRDNAQLMADCHELGYIGDDDNVLDATYGLGRFWKLWRPARLMTNDLHTDADYHYDFVRPPEWWLDNFQVVVFDPPYKLNGTPSKGGPASSDVSYGVGESMRWQDRHTLIRMGIRSLASCVAPGGYLLIKCQDQVSSGAVRWQTREFADHAEGGGCQLVDMLHVNGYRPQPAGRRQVHAARDYSTLLVCRRVAS